MFLLFFFLLLLLLHPPLPFPPALPPSPTPLNPANTTRGDGGSGYPRLFMSVLVMKAAVVVLDIHDDSLTAGMSVLVMTVAPYVHRQYGHVPPWRKSLGGVSPSPRGTRRFF